MSLDPRSQIGETIAGLRLKLEWLRELLLPAGPFEVNHQFTRDRKSDARPKVFFNQGQREIDSRGDAGTGIKLSILHVEGVWLDFQLREAISEMLRVPPMRRDASSVNQPSGRQPVSAGANTGDAPCLRGPFADPFGNSLLSRRHAQSLSAGNDQSIQRRSIPDGPVRLKDNT